MRVDNKGGLASHHALGGAGATKNFGIYIGKVKDYVDKEGLGRLKVWIPQLSSAKETDEESWLTVRYCPPFAGATGTPEESEANNATKFAQTSQSYGFWAVPPHKEVQVICGFINGELLQGIWWACLPFDGHTHSLPGVASGATHTGETQPVAERNRFNTSDADTDRRPEHPKTNQLKGSGLDKDLRRGHNNAGPFRAPDKHPGYAYGFLSPGQNQLLIDDGPDGNSGKIQLRTRMGNTVTIDAEQGFVYIANASGTAWMEFEDSGNIDIYAGKNFSINAVESINFRAGNNINLDASNNINAVATKNFHLEACEIFNATGTTGVRVTSGQNLNLLSDSQMKLSGNRIDLNGPVADRADLPETNSLSSNSTVGTSIAGRVPEAEPYGGHTHTGGEQPSSGPGVPTNTITPEPSSYKDLPPPTDANAVDCIPEISDVRMSEAGFNLMTGRESYRGMMYSDFRGYSIGYGTRLDIFGPTNSASKLDANLKQALSAGPSEAEARMVARQIIDREFTPPLASVIKKALASAGKTVCITQSQVDALIMAAFGNPGAAYEMARQLVASGANAPDGKPTAEDIAKIWANSTYSNDANYRNSEARYAITGKANPDMRVQTADQLRTAGVKSDQQSVLNNKARNPDGQWDTPIGGGPRGTTKLSATYTKPTSQQFGQWERSCYLNTGQIPTGSNLTLEQLRDKYGAVQTGGNNPPATPTQAS